MIDLEEAINRLAVGIPLKSGDKSKIVDAARAYLASQSKLADGVEGDALEQFNRDCRFIDCIGQFSSLVRNDFMPNKHRETIRHALQSTAKMREKVEGLKKASQALIDRWHTPNWKDAEHTGAFIRDLEQALASL